MPLIVPLPSRSSLDSGYDSTSSDLLQEGVPSPLEKTRDRLGSMVLADVGELKENLRPDEDPQTGEATSGAFPPQEPRRDSRSIAVATYAGDKQATGLISQRRPFQTSSAWSPVASMPLDPFDSLPLSLNHTDQSVLLSCKFVDQASIKSDGDFLNIATNTALTQFRSSLTQCIKCRAQEQSIIVETGHFHSS